MRWPAPGRDADPGRLREPERVVAVHEHVEHARPANDGDGAGAYAGMVTGGLKRSSGRIPERGVRIPRIVGDGADRARQHDALSLWRVWLAFMRVAAMDDQVGTIKSGGEELLVALELQRVGHDPAGVRQHPVGGHDDIAFDAEPRHRARRLFRNRLDHARYRPGTHG